MNPTRFGALLLSILILPGLAHAQAPPEAALAGTWEHREAAFGLSVLLILNADRTGVLDDQPVTYVLRGDQIVFTQIDESHAYTFSLKGNQLILSGGDLDAPLTFTRKETGKGLGSKVKEAAAGRNVVINQTRLTAEQIQRIEQQFQVRIVDGAYWYDKACGAWGIQGGPTMGIIPAGLDLGGPLRADASGGGTGVFINGRELHPLDVAALQQITVVAPGRYWVDAIGNCGYEGNPVPIFNVAALAQAARARSGGSYTTRSDITGIGTGGDGSTSYVMGKDWSVIVGD